MKKLIAVFLLGFTFPFMLFSQSQDYAGQDKLICPGGTTQIGSNAPCAGCCYKWSPSTGLDDPGKPNPIVSGLTESTLYSVTVSLPNGNYEVDFVTVYIYNTTISIFKPRFPYSNPNQPDQMLSETGKKLPGAQTIVNIDNDDCDDLFDNEDDVVTGGDDEFVKIRITMNIDLPGLAPLAPNAFLLGPLTYSAKMELAVGGDANGIRFWRSSDKSEGQYMLGDELELSPAGATTYEGFIWAEGLEGHTSPQQTKLKASAFGDNSATCNQSDYVSLTVIGINWVKWEGKENGYTGDGKNNSNTLDELADQPVTTNRVFPEGKFVNNTTISAAKTTVTAKVEFSTAPVESLRLYLRALDVDDPSIETAYIDPNDLGTSGTYAGGAGLAYTKDEDNRGIVSFIGNNQLPAHGKFGAFSGTDVYAANNALGIFYKTASANSSTIFVTDFKVSKYPGDNYRIAVYGDIDFLKNLRNEDQYDQHKIVDKCTGSTTDCKEIAQRYTSPTLTNFRTLHIEYDKMKKANVVPPANENEEIRNAYFKDFEKYTTVTGDKVISVIKDLVNVSDGQPIFPNDGSPGKGRFQGGGVKIGDVAFKLKSITQTQTSSDDVYFGLNGTYPVFYGLTCNLYNGATLVHSSPVADIEKPTSGDPKYKVTLLYSIPPNVSFGLAAFGGATFKSSSYKLSSTQVGIYDNDIRIPVQLKDDDSIDNLPYEPSADAKSVIETAYKDAYIDAVFDGGGNMDWVQADLDFDMNLPHPNGNYIQDTYYDASSIANLKPLEKDDYWGANLIFGWQAGTKEDGDPDIGEVIYLGGTPADPTQDHHCNLSNGWDVSFIAVETIRDIYNTSGDVEPRIGRTIAHEIGHQFGLTHGQVPGPCATCIGDCSMVGVMTDGITNNSLIFIPVHLNLLRSRAKSPKK